MDGVTMTPAASSTICDKMSALTLAVVRTGGKTRAHKTIRNIKSAWIKEQQVRLENGKIIEYQVNMMITFVLED
jgi:flavin-binding protein dodecin